MIVLSYFSLGIEHSEASQVLTKFPEGTNSRCAKKLAKNLEKTGFLRPCLKSNVIFAENESKISAQVVSKFMFWTVEVTTVL